MDKQTMGIYIHIPFCVRKCEYCDFLSDVGSAKEMISYVEALILEIKSYTRRKYPVSSIFFGGGTPSIIGERHISSIMNVLKDTFIIEESAEITLEANPGTLTREKIRGYRKAGINRISLGLQSTNNEELKALGRIHTYEEFLASYEIVRQEGICNVNVDLMSGLPLQSIVSWENTLKRVVTLKPEHISAYGLIIEEGTPFFRLYADDDRKREEGEVTKYLPGEAEEREMYHLTKKILKGNGYERYEISNYAKRGYECRHNIGYWKRTNYIGFGIGSSSMIDNVRFTNQSDIHLYIEGKETPGSSSGRTGEQIPAKEEKLSVKEQMEEFMFLGLRMMEGICIGEFERQFEVSFQKVYGTVIKNLVNKGLLVNKDHSIRFTEAGIDVSNYVLAEFLF